jgi:hypothetical protein
MDKLIDRILTFQKDPNGKFWLTHYAYVMLGRRPSDSLQRLPILGSYAELSEEYMRAFKLLAVLHGVAERVWLPLLGHGPPEEMELSRYSQPFLKPCIVIPSKPSFV